MKIMTRDYHLSGVQVNALVKAMTFDWTIAKLYLNNGKKVRISNWNYGLYLVLDKRTKLIVDQNNKVVSPSDIHICSKVIYWTEYKECFHGHHRNKKSENFKGV